MTPEQQKALALARARRRREEAGAVPPREEPASVGVAEDVAKGTASGLARGILDLAGLPGTVRDAMQSGGEWALRKGYEAATGEAPSPEGGMVERFFAGPTPEVREALALDKPGIGSGAQFRGIASGMTGGATEYEAQTTPGKFAGTIAEFVPGAVAFGGANPANLTRFAALPGAASEAAGQMTEGSEAEPYTRIAAALLAPLAPSAASRAISPLRVSPERQAAVDILRREGVEPTAGQATGSTGLRYAESEIGGNRASQMMEDQAEAFTDAAMRRAGASGRATADNMASVNERLGKGFDDIASRNAVRVDQGLVDDMNATMREYMRALPSEQQTLVKNIAQDIVDRFKQGGGSMSGSDYQKIRSRLTQRAQNARGNNNDLADAYRGLRNALDEGMARSVSPDDAAEWARLRREYGNMKTLEKAASGAGEDAALGLISPARLRQAAASGKNRGSYARGEGDLAEIARAGNAILAPLPNSGTAARTAARNLGAGLLAGGGALTGGLPGMLAGLALPPVAGRALMSKPVQRYLMNNVAPEISAIDPRQLAVIEALIGQQLGVPQREGVPGGR